MKATKVLLYALSVVISLATIAYLFVTLDWTTLEKLFSQIRWGWIVLAFGIYFLSIVFRAMRFRTLLYSKSVSMNELIPLSSLHNMFVYVMPAKSGDVSYILLSKGRLMIPFSEGTATLLAARFYDFLIVAGILALVLPVAGGGMPAWIFQSAAVFCTCVLAGAVLILNMVGKPWVKVRQPDTRRPWFSRLAGAWNKFVGGLAEIRARHSQLAVGLLTLGIWLCLYADYYSMAQALGTPITFSQISIITLVMVPLTLLPLQGFANIGTHEVGWVSVLSAFGYSYQSSLAIAVGSHFILLVCTLCYGGLGLIAMRLLDRTKK